MLALQCGTVLDCAATQMWALKEGRRKAGAALTQSISLVSSSPDGWGLFSAGSFRAAAFHARLQEYGVDFAFAFVLNCAP
jgi:hypothetical protein